MKYIAVFIFLLISIIQVYSQNLKGFVSDSFGVPLIGTSVIIKETSQGVVCNEKGYYQLSLPKGKYSLIFHSIGFKQSFHNVEIQPNDNAIELNVVLEPNLYELKEVSVGEMEDPAYRIMRDAINKAPYHLSRVSNFKAEAYIKGTMELHSISKLLDKIIERSEGIKGSELKNQIFVQESFNEIEFTLPNQYKQNLKAFSSSIPDNFDSQDAIGIMNGSLYSPEINGFISPLNKRAFSYYKFKYEGFTEEDGIYVNKIKVVPKVKDPSLLEGHIYIADDTWHLHSCELRGNVYGVTQDFTVKYISFNNKAFLPVTYMFMYKIDLMGTSATMKRVVSMKYTDIQFNDSVDIETSRLETKRKGFQVNVDSLYLLTSDTLAKNRDSEFWNMIRTLPLEDDEQLSLLRKDSIQNYIDSVRSRRKGSNFSFGNLVFGGQIGTDSSFAKLKYEGLFHIIPKFNYVDGFWVGNKIRVIKEFDNKQVALSPFIYYVTARKELLGGADLIYNYAPMRLGELAVSAGSTSADFSYVGTDRVDNAVSSLLWGENLSYYYQRNYISLSNKIDISNGLTFIAGFDLSQRYGLQNNTNYSFFGEQKKVRPNIKYGEKFDKTSFSLGFSYAPRAYYSVNKGKKKYECNASPNFTLKYKQGLLNKYQTNSSVFRKMIFIINQEIQLDYFKKIEYELNIGTFLGSTSKTDFTDFHHFNASNTFSTCKIPFESYLLLDSYARSTNRHWVDANVNYMSKYILLKRLPFLQGKMFTESLHIRTLYTPDHDFYSELGYAVNLSKYLNFGVYSAFEGLEYKKLRLRLSIKLPDI